MLDKQYIPNALCIARAISGPCIFWLIINGFYICALATAILSAITDFLDGFLARKLHAESELGKVLDPVADKLLVFCLFAALFIKQNIPGWLITITVLRDVSIIAGGIILMKKSNGIIDPMMISKVNTCFQLILASFCMISFFIQISSIITALVIATSITTIASWVIYAQKFICKMGKISQ